MLKRFIQRYVRALELNTRLAYIFPGDGGYRTARIAHSGCCLIIFFFSFALEPRSCDQIFAPKGNRNARVIGSGLPTNAVKLSRRCDA